MLIEQRALHVPDDADVVTFVLSGGQQVKKAGEERKEVVPAEPVTLERLKKKYIDTLSIGAVEENSLNTVDLHLRHFVKTLGATFPFARPGPDATPGTRQDTSDGGRHILGSPS